MLHQSQINWKRIWENISISSLNLCNIKSIGTYTVCTWCGSVLWWTAFGPKSTSFYYTGNKYTSLTLLLNYDSALTFTFIQSMVGWVNCGQTYLVMGWKPPHCHSVSKWYLGFPEDISWELSIVSIKNANKSIIEVYSKNIKGIGLNIIYSFFFFLLMLFYMSGYGYGEEGWGAGHWGNYVSL